MAKLIVITGGACSGKTSVIAELAARGYGVLPEAAIEVIDELNGALGVEGQVAWRRENLVEFQRRLGNRQHAREVEARAVEAPVVFCDRGLPDGLVYCRMGGEEWPEDMYALAASARYHHAFVLETLAGFDPRRETGRIDTREGSIRTAALLEAVYRDRAATVTRVPEMSIAARADLVLRSLGLDA